MTDEDWAFIERFVAERRWQFAKTMPTNPHEYTIRQWEPDRQDEFERFVELVHTEGFTAKWGTRYWPYLDVGEHTYFTFGAKLHQTIVINRKPCDQVEGDRAGISWDERRNWR